jgi:GNAT superfamily N-acetyltransferase
VISESVRPARPADTGDLRRLVTLERTDLTGERDGLLWATMDAPVDVDWPVGALSDPSCAVWIAELDAVPFGFISVVRQSVAGGKCVAVVDHLFVEPGARELSLGEWLLEAATRWAQAAGCVGIEAMALPGAREAKNLFERAGLKARKIIVYRAFDDGGRPT